MQCIYRWIDFETNSQYSQEERIHTYIHHSIPVQQQTERWIRSGQVRQGRKKTD